MKGIQYTSKEIYEAKKILYEGSDITRKTLIGALAALVSLIFLLILSLHGDSDQWVCEINSNENRHDYICKELRKAVNCKTISGPMKVFNFINLFGSFDKAEVLLNIKNEVKASALVICPWEIAVSELRVCFILLAFVCICMGFYAIRTESKKFADLHFQSAIFFAVLLLISSYYDFVSISNSKVSNYNLCNLKDEFEVDKSVMSEMMLCSYDYYYATIIMGVISSFLLLMSSYNIYKWKDTIVIGGI